MFGQINAALVNIRDFFKTKQKNKNLTNPNFWMVVYNK